MNYPQRAGDILEDYYVNRHENKRGSTFEATQEILDLITEAQIAEWEPFLTAEIAHGGSPAPFNPEGLSITTSRTKDLTELLQGYAKNRIEELKPKTGGQ